MGMIMKINTAEHTKKMLDLGDPQRMKDYYMA